MQISRNTAIAAPAVAQAIQRFHTSILATADGGNRVLMHTVMLKRSETPNSLGSYLSDEKTNRVRNSSNEHKIKVRTTPGENVAGRECKCCCLVKKLEYPITAAECVNATSSTSVDDVNMLARMS